MTTAGNVYKKETPKIELEKHDGKTRIVFVIPHSKDEKGRDLLGGRLSEEINIQQSDQKVAEDAVKIGIERMHYFDKADQEKIAEQVIAILPKLRK